MTSRVSPFMKNLILSFDSMDDGFTTVHAYNDEGMRLFTEQWISFLSFQHEPSFYGLHHDEETRFSTLELVELFSPLVKHPYVHVSGYAQEDESTITTIQQAADLWSAPTLWNDIEFEEGSLVLTTEEVTPDAKVMLTSAIQQKLYGAGLTMADIPTLLPFFKQGGWPLQAQSGHTDVNVALRLSEPESFSDEWLLETVVRGKKSSVHWTPAFRKKESPIADALPDKWKIHAPYVYETQANMLELMNIEADTDRFLSRTLSDLDVRHFLRDDAARLQALGFEVILPGWLKAVKESKLRVKSNAKTASFKTTAGLNEILTFDWHFSLNGQAITEDQFKQMVEENREYIRAGNEWFRIDSHWMHEIRQLMEQTESEDWTVKELLFRELPDALVLDEDNLEEEEDPLFQFELNQSLQKYLEQLQDKKGLPTTNVSPHLLTELRPYQQQGFDWLVFMREQGFGVCLADDMGLGKTVQLIAYLLHVHRTKQTDKPSFIICPTSVLGNWQKELARFAPDLDVHVHYGQTRSKDESMASELISMKPDVVLTTFGTASQDAEALSEIEWASVTLDEAQNIKNMHTKQSRAIRKLRGEHHLALTGTPVENRLSELWAIFDFIYKGYLGSFRKFQENFIAPIERDESENHKQKLRNKIRPFLLRRTKQDPDLLLNLPDKQEQREYCPLTTEQAALYESLIQETLFKLETLTGFEKKGLILKMLSKLKQLCNHPALYLKEGFGEAEYMMERSEKLAQIVTLAAEIAERGEQCLIFTQYIGMGHLLQHCLSELHDIDPPFLTGSMPKAQRDRLVEAFQEKEFPVFILSLKAGGTGLNLTAANHVLHADRWWNPAVENQATDRAYRIGQTRFVHVHKFVTIGTIEEKIDKLLADKQALSEDLIQSSQWITELADDDLKELLTLG
ncbi:DEAD/DEAH box helicase [Paenisporosarcina quisquiliarum]|uniref:DEAD/DEAH box helicase n=1 Tax=Paenisporosarcina quisquiliarum TaxID=365346 RepID=A0A9X3RD54_9BACL|nr:DEAD/DEAH box helicase [Paenisporosarcina quisquiliarum]MCZ8537226.1 DEAD/DEAH box helicase [Paenisporosarcina quisquiliarum]